MMTLDVETVFFEALTLPTYARPNFYLRNQKESGWDKYVYLRALSGIYQFWSLKLRMRWNSNLSKNPNAKEEDVSIDYEAVQIENRPIRITKEVLDDLDLVIDACYLHDNQKKEYSPVEIFSFVEYALWFIRNEFKYQIGEVTSLHGRPRTNSYFNYLIIQDAPFFDFPRFKVAVREILLFSTKSNKNIEKVLRKYLTASKEIVSLWNNKVFKLLDKKDSQTGIINPVMVHVGFNGETLSHSWWNDTGRFENRSPKLFLNQDFAGFASKIATLLGSELGEPLREANVKEVDFVSDFIDGIEQLMELDDRHEGIKKIRAKEKTREHSFRDHFQIIFNNKEGYSCDPETLKGNKRIDLRVKHSAFGKKIIEFKGWWNRDKKTIIKQVSKYVTDFQTDGYIFMINNNQSSIMDQYKAIVTVGDGVNYVADTWEEVPFSHTGYKYYKTNHTFGGKPYTIYHFIFDIYGVTSQ